MKTVNHLFKVVRLLILLLLGLFLLSLCLMVLFQGGDSEIKLIVLLVPASIFLGLLLGYRSGINRIKRQVFSCFNDGILIAAQGPTVISGKLSLFMDGLKCKGIVLEKSSFSVAPSTVSKVTHTLVLGDLRLLK